MLTKDTLWAGIVAALLAGCATPPLAYKEPQSGPTAQIVFLAEYEMVNHRVVHYRGSLDGCDCSAEPVEVIGVFHNRAVLLPGSSSYADKGNYTNKFAVRVPADGREFRFLIDFAGNDPRRSDGFDVLRYCQAHQSFVPQPDKTYEVALKRCSARVFETEQGRRGHSLPAKSLPMCAPRRESDVFSDMVREHCAKHPEIYKRLPSARQ